MFSKLQNYFDELSKKKITVSNTAAGSILIAPKERNPIGRDVTQILFETFEDAGFLTYKTADGVVIAVPNDSLADMDEVTGDICFSLKVTVKGLDYDAELESDAYAAEREAAEEKKQAAARRKQIAFENSQRAREAKRLAQERKRQQTQGKSDSLTEEEEEE